jgi:hypothetical protein
LRSNFTAASSGGFASVASNSSLLVTGARIERAMALGTLAATARFSAQDLWQINTLLRRLSPSGGGLCANRIAALEQLQALEYYASTQDSTSGDGGGFQVRDSGRLSIANAVLAEAVAVKDGGSVHFALSTNSKNTLKLSNVSVLGSVAMKGATQFVEVGATPLAESIVGLGQIADAWKASTTVLPSACARVGPHLASSAGFLRVSVAQNNSDSNGIALLSGGTLGKVNVTILDLLNQTFLDASFVSLTMGVSGSKSNVSIMGRTNAFGSFGSAEFAASSIRIYGPPGIYALFVASDSLFPIQYPSSRLNSSFAVTIAPCPPGRYVAADRSCQACALGTTNSASESTLCTPVASGFFTIDGVSVRDCSETDGSTIGVSAGVNGLTAQQSLEMKRKQCPTSSLSPVVVAVSIVIPVCVMAAAGVAGVMYYRRVIRAAESERKSWLVNPREIEWIKVIGQGSFGQVHMCRYRETIVCVKRILMPSEAPKNSPEKKAILKSNGEATSRFQSNWKAATANRTREAAPKPPSPGKEVKKVDEAELDTSIATQIEEAEELLEEEIKIHVTLRHPNVVLFMGAVMEEKNICLMTEFMDLGWYAMF